jgi:hypothetical protein
LIKDTGGLSKEKRENPKDSVKKPCVGVTVQEPLLYLPYRRVIPYPSVVTYSTDNSCKGYILSDERISANIFMLVKSPQAGYQL